MKICIVGSDGYVGKAMVEFLSSHHEIITKEKNDGRSFSITNDCDLTIICVPTSMNSDGSCDTSIVEEVIQKSNCNIYLLKSTVPPGTTDFLIEKYKREIVFSPEFIGEGGYPIPYWSGIPHSEDMRLHRFHIFGGVKKSTNFIIEMLSKVAGPYCRFIQTEAKTAEMVKYVINCFLATKVVFFHEMAGLCDIWGIDYNDVREMVLLDKRISRGHTLIFDREKGFGGKCLPKDINALYQHILNSGKESLLIKSIIEVNDAMRGIKNGQD